MAGDYLYVREKRTGRRGRVVEAEVVVKLDHLPRGIMQVQHDGATHTPVLLQTYPAASTFYPVMREEYASARPDEGPESTLARKGHLLCAVTQIEYGTRSSA